MCKKLVILSEDANSLMSCQANPLAELVRSQQNGEIQNCTTLSALRSDCVSCLDINTPVPIGHSIARDLELAIAFHAKKDTRTQKLLCNFQPHFGLESIGASNFALGALSKFAGIDLPDTILREIEGIILLITNLSQQTTALGVTSAILLHVRAFSSKSITSTVHEYINDIFSTGEDETQSGSEFDLGNPNWLSCLRNVRQNWQMCKNNKAFAQISKLLGVFVVMGLCKSTDLEFNIGKFKMFTPNLFERHMSAFDLADAMFETVLFFAEGMYLCFKTGSLRPLLLNDHSALEMDEEYAKIQSWWDLVKVGNLARLTGMPDQEFERRLNELTSNLKNLSGSLKGLDKKLVLDKYSKCLIMQNDFVTMKISSGVRHAPFAIELFGESSQGKTTLGDQLLDALLASQSLPTGKEYRAAFNASDKYMSNWTSDKLVLIFDDMSNEKSSFVERPPTRAILDVCNNQMYYANKAELEAKGKCFVEPWLVVATTNKKDLDAALYSNCPYSIQRRMVCYTVKVKPEFRKIRDGVDCGIDATKVRLHYTIDGVYSPPAFDDIWIVDIEEAVKPPSMSTIANYKCITWRGKEMKGVSMKEVIQYSIDAFAEHRMNQESLLEGMRARNHTLELCHVIDCPHLKGICPDHMDNQFGKETVKTLHKLCSSAKNRFLPNIPLWTQRADEKAAEILYTRGTDFLKSWDWIKVVPSSCFESDYAITTMRWVYQDRLETDVWKQTANIWTSFFLLVPFLFVLGIYWIVPLFFFFYQALRAQALVNTTVEQVLFDELKESNRMIRPIVKKYRDDCAYYVCGTFIGLAALYGIAKAYRAWKQSEVQGSLEPKTAEQVAERDDEANVWCEVIKTELPITVDSKTVSTEQLFNVVSKNLVYGSIHIPGQDNGRVNGLFLNSNVILLPNHYFDEFGDTLNCTLRKKNPDANGGKFAARISKTASSLIPNTDLRVCYCATGGSFKDLVKHFPISNLPQVPFRLQWRHKDGTLLHAKGLTEPGMVSTVVDFIGGKYKNLSIDTFKGLCGAVLVSETIGATIIGVHLGGVSGTPNGCYGAATQQELKTAIDAMRIVEGVIVSGSAEKFETQVLGVNILTKPPLHPKSALNYMPLDSQVEYYGSCPGRALSKSDVKVTPISEAIMDVCGVPNIYQAPKMNPEWYGWQTCLANLSVPAHPYQHELLVHAVMDYKSELLPIFKNEMWSSSRPLTDHENLCGIPGKKFMDAIKLNTSIGYPLSGPKRKFVTELESTEDKPNNRVLDPVIMDEIKRCEDCYRRGERAYPIAKACKKDEILAKPKCRIFYGNALSLTFLIRKYYLPVLRVLQMNPLVSECAVGINSHGPEWEEFHQHATKFGMDRLFGGDYGKYDQKLPSQLIFASLRIMIDLARLLDYSQKDLEIMEAMTGDIVYAVIAYNGDLIGLTEGTHISGNSLTVVINGICGSLNLRAFYYSKHPFTDFEKRRKFRDYVSAMTYGDDNIGSVHKDEHDFTIKGISEFLASYGQVYTMPDKESELKAFLDEEEFEFLKRSSVHHPQLGVHTGALLDKSIFKSLHCFMRSKGCEDTEETACAKNIDGALREWFNHGEEHFEFRRKEMIEVASKTGISHICTGLDVGYAQRVNEWHSRYNKKYVPFQKMNGDLFEGLDDE